MASLKLEHIYKVYPNGTKAVNDFNIDVKDGEFIVLVGPSGCGKSTTLRMIAGLEDITAGEMFIGNQIVNDMEPKDRDIAMVFQNYALYPHMTVYENMAFGLKLRHVPNDVIQEKVLWAADILGIREYLDRKPKAMSGGQRQRVALGRAILRNPKVMLLDEPLSNLDAKLRTQMRTEIAKLHQKLKTTFVYVTHDQVEAMTLGDRVVVMKKGEVQQIDSPKNLYDYPTNVFVAGFIGTPQMNFFNGSLIRKGNLVEIHFDDGNTLVTDYNKMIKVNPTYLDGKHKVIIGVRCEHVHIVDEKESQSIEATVSRFEELGSECLIYCSLKKGTEEKIDGESSQLIIKVKEIGSIKTGDSIHVTFDMDHTYFFDKTNEHSILPRIPVYNSFDGTIADGKLKMLGQTISLPSAIKIQNDGELEIRIPSDAFAIGTGTIPAVVTKEEVINGKRLLNLETNGRIYFALVDKDYEVGQSLNIGFDFSRITVCQNGKVLAKPIEAFDAIKGTFSNFDTVLKKDNNPAFVDFKKNKMALAATFIDAKIEVANKKFEDEKEKLTPETCQKISAESKEKFVSTLKNNWAKLRALKKETAQKLREMEAKFNSTKKDLKKANDALFAKKMADEKKELAEFKANNKDRDLLKRKMDEFHMFKDTFPEDRDNALKVSVNSLALDYDSQTSTLRASSRRQSDLLKKEIKETFLTYWKNRNPLKNLTKEHDKTIRSLEAQKNRAVKRASFIFFFNFPDDYHVMSTDIIANKLVQGLGTHVFTREFLVKLPHDAYKVSTDGRGLDVRVLSNLDYSTSYFAKLQYKDQNGNPQELFMKVSKPLAVGSEFKVSFDIDHSQIIETSQMLRLY